MVAFARRVLALLLLAASSGCGGRPAVEDPASSGTPTSHATATARYTASTQPVLPVSSPAVSSPAVSSPAVPSRSPSAVGRIPPVSVKARAAGLIDVRTIVPDAIVELRYATSDNFVGVPLYPPDARCLVHDSMAAGLVAAADRLRRQGDVLVFWDCYRPHPVQVRMFEIVPDPNWVARPGPLASSHEAARSVDITLASATTGQACPPAQRVQGHCLLEMGTDFDDFSPRAHAFATDQVSRQAQSNRARLRSAMNSGGITVYSGEWWHFDGPGAVVRRPHLDAPLG
ncbi:MAG: zinc D-Ala-D-Ala dipeptidase [Pseudonocardiales bacterium]|nr:zinc D-Ala-D-Ala dipeptidase [Pseudonocardiales bacterium]